MLQHVCMNCGNTTVGVRRNIPHTFEVEFTSNDTVVYANEKELLPDEDDDDSISYYCTDCETRLEKVTNSDELVDYVQSQEEFIRDVIGFLKGANSGIDYKTKQFLQEAWEYYHKH